MAIERASPGGEELGMSGHKFFLAVACLRQYSHYFRIVLVFLSIVIPLAVLYFLDPLMFNRAFNGRAYYLFFVWLVVLEFVLDWDKYGAKTVNNSVKRNLAFGVALMLPTCYVIASKFFGLNAAIVEMFRPFGIISPWLDNTPITMEFVAFTVLFAIIILLSYGRRGLADFSLPIALLGAVAVYHMINILYPYGDFAPFQFIVPTTTTLSADVLNLMGYQTKVLLNPTNPMPQLYAWNSEAVWGFQIAWPCAGVESLLIYTVVILLFLKKSNIRWLHRVIYFAIGAIVTYFINVLRIVTIFILALNQQDYKTFHDYNGMLYSAIWIVSYPLIIIGSRALWNKLKIWNLNRRSNKMQETTCDANFASV